MKSEILYNGFLEEIARRIPQKIRAVNILSDLLCLGKEAIYRRLRGEMQFTFFEAMTISRHLNIPLDALETDDSPISKSFRLNLIEYINPVESDFALLEEMAAILKTFEDVTDPEVGEITNILPQPLYVVHESIFRFYLFKWKYQSNTSDKALRYKDIKIVDKLHKTQQEYVKWARRLDTEYIFDHQLFHNMVTNIKYFYYIGLITKEDIGLIKQDLLKILKEIEFMSSSGQIKETGKKINLYISDISVDTNYIYVAAQDYKLVIIKVFLLNGIASTDSRTFDEVKHWVQSAKRQSILITKSNEKERFNYMKEQFDLIESLSQL